MLKGGLEGVGVGVGGGVRFEILSLKNAIKVKHKKGSSSRFSDNPVLYILMKQQVKHLIVINDNVIIRLM